MKAFVIAEQGAPVRLMDREIPVPRRGQAVVRNFATTLNFHDVLNIQGVVPNMTWPHVPFSDNCGEIVALGEDTGTWQVGERVMANFFPDWLDGAPTPEYCLSVYGDNRDGFLQEYTLVESKSLARVPDYLGHAEAASLCCAGLTAWRSIAVEACVQPGQVVVVQGTGGVSLFALQFAKMFGARVILTSSSDEKLDFGKKLGADFTINYRKHPDWDLRVLELTDGVGADVIVEIGGADTLPRSINAVRFNGHVSVIGVRSGAGVQTSVSPEMLLIKNIHLRGITVGSVRHLNDMCRALEQHRVTPVVEHHFEMGDVDRAIELMETQSHMGKIAIEIAN
ncbi:MAG: NAD(P)-dependent alcohol dehydrogenase [Porticoccaceae bacterium]